RHDRVGLGVVVADLSHAQGLVGRRDEARGGEARGEADARFTAERIAAGDATRTNLTTGGAAELGVVARLLDLDLLHELLDQGRADGSERRVGDVRTLDGVLGLGTG